MKEIALTLQELAAEMGVPARTIRYYQAEGYIPAPKIVNRRAIYSSVHVERLTQMLAKRGAKKFLGSPSGNTFATDDRESYAGAPNAIGYEELLRFSLREGVDLVVSRGRSGLDRDGIDQLSSRVADFVRGLEEESPVMPRFETASPASSLRLLTVLQKAGLDNAAFRRIHPKQGETIDRHLRYLERTRTFQANSTNVYINHRLQLCEKYLQEAQESGKPINWIDLASKAAEAVALIVRND